MNWINRIWLVLSATDNRKYPIGWTEKIILVMMLFWHCAITSMYLRKYFSLSVTTHRCPTYPDVGLAFTKEGAASAGPTGFRVTSILWEGPPTLYSVRELVQVLHITQPRKEIWNFSQKVVTQQNQYWVQGHTCLGEHDYVRRNLRSRLWLWSASRKTLHASYAKLWHTLDHNFAVDFV